MTGGGLRPSWTRVRQTAAATWGAVKEMAEKGFRRATKGNRGREALFVACDTAGTDRAKQKKKNSRLILHTFMRRPIE